MCVRDPSPGPHSSGSSSWCAQGLWSVHGLVWARRGGCRGSSGKASGGSGTSASGSGGISTYCQLVDGLKEYSFVYTYNLRKVGLAVRALQTMLVPQPHPATCVAEHSIPRVRHASVRLMDWKGKGSSWKRTYDHSSEQPYPSEREG